MGKLSEDESSDSSSEFLVPADKIDLSSSFFNESAKAKKSNPKKKAAPASKQKEKQQPQQQPKQLSDDSDDDQFDYASDNFNSAELLSQVLKNLENVNNRTLVSKVDQSDSTKNAKQSTDSKGKDLSTEINDLLLQGESAATLSKQDEVEDIKPEIKPDYKIPEKGVQIHLPGENLMYDRKKKKQRDLQKVLQSKINQRIRLSQNFIHRVGMLTWLAHGFHLNKLSNDTDLLGICLSLMTQNNYPKEKPDMKYFDKFTKWFGGQFSVVLEHKEVPYNKESLLQRVSEKKVYNYVELVLLYIATVRGMGINCRLVISLRPPPLKPRPDQLFKVPKEGDTSIKKEDEKSNKENGKVKKESEKTKTSTKTPLVKSKNGRGKKASKEPSVSPTKIVPENSREVAKAEARKKAAAILKGNTPQKEEKASSSKSEETTSRARRSVAAKKIEYMSEAENDSEEEKSLSIAQKLRQKVDKNGTTNKGKGKKPNAKSTSNKKRKYSSSEEVSEPDEESDFSTDEEYVDKKPKKKVAKTVNKSQTAAKKSLNKSKISSPNKLLSSDDEITVNAFNIWVEVYVEAEGSWICVDILDKKINCASEIYKKSGNPVLYIVAWNTSDTVKDVTRRYCPHWLTDTRKKRVDEKWWNDTLQPWQEKKTKISKAEDEQLLTKELEQPLPKTMSECKGHPLYVLARHLLKFEALYPPDAVPLGHLKTGDAIYSRHCVHTLCSRETWVKKARVVKPAQEAYKVVKSMPKWDKLSGQKIKNQPLELFGKWQTNPYEPPEIIDGVIPRNEYGNVDLFKMCMLPKGGAYVNLPGLNRISRKLNIDCAPACVGFTFGTRGALPAFEGFVVAKEHEDMIREAWEEEQILAQKRAEEKREKRVYGNWKKLIKGLLIRRKLAAKYNFGEDDDTEDDKKSNKKKPTVPIEVPTTTKKTVAKKEPKMRKNAGLLVKLLKSDSEGDDNDTDNKPKSRVRAAKKSVPPPKKKPVRTGVGTPLLSSDDDEEEVEQPTKPRKSTVNKQSTKVDSDEESLDQDSDIDINATRTLRKRNANKTFKEPDTDEDLDEDEEDGGRRRKEIKKKTATTDRGARLRDAVKQALAGEDSDDEWKSDDAEDDGSDFEEDDDDEGGTAKTPSRGLKRGKSEVGNARKKVKR